MIRLYPYKTASRSVRLLKEALDALIIKTENSRYRYRPEHTLINWGNTRTPHWMDARVQNRTINQPEHVATAANKMLTLRALQSAGVAIPAFTHSLDHARYWRDNGHTVFARTRLTGHSGEGIVTSPPHELIVDAPLYTRGIENHGEYRVHVFNGGVILYQKKSRRVDDDGNVLTPEGEEALVRNLQTNWVYRTGHLRRLERVEQLALDAIEALSLDFGAVDIIMDEDGDVYVLEINTAPGLGNQQTLDAYVDAINNLTA